MIDALLFSVRDAIIAGGFGYSASTCEVMDSGEPPPRCGKEFVAVHQAATRTSSETDNKLEEYFGFSVTRTQRIVAPLDQVGWKELAIKLAKQTGFNRRCEQLRAFLHMNWGILQDANNNLKAWAPDNQGTVYGFCEPARYRGMEKPKIVASSWFRAEHPQGKGDDHFGIVSELTFGDARRFQPIAEYV